MVIIRADGNENIGAGHIMRCISIADAIRNIGGDVVFVLAGDSFETMLREKGFDVFVLHTDYSNMESECDSMLSLIKQYHADKCIVDSYYVTDSYFRTLRSATRIVYVDDLMDHAHPVDVLVNYNIYAEPAVYAELYQKSGTDKPLFLLGCDYAPLRNEFAGVDAGRNMDRNSVFVSSGGTDFEHIELRLLERILQETNRFESVQFHFVVGALNPDWMKLQSMSEGASNIRLYRNAANMKDLMEQCGLAVSAAGSTMYELCRCGLPVVTYVVADNQIQSAKAFERNGNAVYAGDSRKCPDLPDILLQTVERLIGDKNVCDSMSRMSGALLDGKGAARIALAIM